MIHGWRGLIVVMPQPGAADEQLNEPDLLLTTSRHRNERY